MDVDVIMCQLSRSKDEDHGTDVLEFIPLLKVVEYTRNQVDEHKTYFQMLCAESNGQWR